MSESLDYGDVSITPPQAQYESEILSWSMEAIAEGEQFLKGQPGYEKADDTIRSIMSVTDSGEGLPGPLSKSNVNQFGKIALDLRSGLTDTKVFWEYRTNNPRYEQSGVMATKLARAWWLNSQSDMRFADGMSWCFAAGSAAMRLVYNRESGQQELQAWDVRDVLPVRANDYLDYNSGFAVILRKANSVNYLRALYPNLKDRIKADTDGPNVRTGSGVLWDKLASVASPLLKGVLRDSAARSGSLAQSPSCMTYIIEVKDDSMNKTGQTVLMGPHDKSGRPTQSWSYAVAPGDPLYPRGRQIVLTKNCVLYDGPNPYWHGRFDVLKLTLDQWPFSFLGKSPLWDLLDPQRDLTYTIRVLANIIKKIERPGAVADKNSVSNAEWSKMDTALAGLKVRQNPGLGKGIMVDDVAKYAAVIPQLLAVIALHKDNMESLSGVKDVTNFASLGQIPASETIERLMEAMSPAIRARSRTLESFLRPLGFMVLGNNMQFMTMAKRVRALGPSGAVLEDFDMDPGVLLPDFVDESDHDALGHVTATAKLRGAKSRYERALTFMPQFEMIVEPGSLLAASEISRKLLTLQLARAGYIDVVTLLETLGIPNIGAPADIPQTIIGRLQWQQQQQLAVAANSAGRKATGQQPPQMRSDGRISESG